MAENICSVCGEKFEDKYFDKEQNKCMLHCEKDEWDENANGKYNNFIGCLISFTKNDKINSLKMNKTKELEQFLTKDRLVLKGIVFPNDNSFLLALECLNKNIFFEECKFLDNNMGHTFYSKKKNHNYIFSFKDICFRNCIFNEKNYFTQEVSNSKDVYFSNFNCDSLCLIQNEDKDVNIHIKNSTYQVLHLSEVSFSLKKIVVEDSCFFGNIRSDNKLKNVTIDNCNFKGKTHFIGHFDSFNIINQSKIEQNLKLNNLNISSLNIQNSELIKGIELNNTLIEEKINFINTTFGEIKNDKSDFELDLSYTNLPSFKNFLKLKTEVKNRETARIIKNSFEQQNNIIEANKFYALEMKEREKELEDDLKKGKNFFEWLVFKIHGISSNHSQDWLLALFWIIVFGFGFSLIKFYMITENDKFIHFNILSFLGIFLLVIYGVWLNFI